MKKENSSDGYSHDVYPYKSQATKEFAEKQQFLIISKKLFTGGYLRTAFLEEGTSWHKLGKPESLSILLGYIIHSIRFHFCAFMSVFLHHS